MKSDVIKVSENVVKLYVRRYPQQADFDIYRGDSWSYTVIGLNADDTPFDWSIAESIRMNFRSGHPLNPVVAATLTGNNFTFGKTDTTRPAFDKLQITDQFGTSFRGLLTPKLFYDLELTIGGDPLTPMRGTAYLEYDVTSDLLAGIYTWDSADVTFDNNSITWDSN